MKKEEIIALGIEEEVAHKLTEAFKKELEGFIPKSRFDEVNEAKKNAEALIKERDKQLEELKKASGDSEALQKQIEELQEANKATAKDYETKITQMKTDNAVEKAITERNGKNATAIKALLDMTKVKLNEDGTTTGLDEQLEALVKGEDSSFLFGSNVPEVKGFNPAKGKEGGAGDEADFSKMSYDQICAYMEANPDANIS